MKVSYRKRELDMYLSDALDIIQWSFQTGRIDEGLKALGDVFPDHFKNLDLTVLKHYSKNPVPKKTRKEFVWNGRVWYKDDNGDVGVL